MQTYTLPTTAVSPNIYFLHHVVSRNSDCKHILHIHVHMLVLRILSRHPQIVELLALELRAILSHS